MHRVRRLQGVSLGLRSPQGHHREGQTELITISKSNRLGYSFGISWEVLYIDSRRCVRACPSSVGVSVSVAACPWSLRHCRRGGGKGRPKGADKTHASQAKIVCGCAVLAGPPRCQDPAQHIVPHSHTCPAHPRPSHAYSFTQRCADVGIGQGGIAAVADKGDRAR